MSEYPYICRHGKLRTEHWCDDHADHDGIPDAETGFALGVEADPDHFDPCDITTDGWCATHSASDGPAYCNRRRLP